MKTKSLIIPILCGCLTILLASSFMIPASAQSHSSEKGYRVDQDPFYAKSHIYVTWINVWNASTENWWKKEDTKGIQYLFNGQWQSLDLNNLPMVHQICREAKAAGIDVIVCDLTNGLRWEGACKEILKFCYENEMKMAVAINQYEKVEDYEAQAKSIWNAYVNPEAEYASAYFYLNGKPLIVNYTWKESFDKTESARPTLEYGSKFIGTWASGEDSQADKWGWQLESLVGPMPSGNAMFITPSIANHKTEKSKDDWRKSMAWLDYTFAVARQHHPKYYVVGSMDDVFERNGWLKADTTNAVEKSNIMRDIHGNVSIDVLYKRVSEWIKNTTAKAFNGGGIIKDGAYEMMAPSDNRKIAFNENSAGTRAAVSTEIQGTPAYLWFYHLGDNEYRIVKLCAGLSLGADGDNVVINWDQNIKTQRWKVNATGAETYTITNVEQGKKLGVAGDHYVVLADKGEWKLKAVLTLEEN